MKNDPVIDEVRRVRHQISAECGHDAKRMVDYYMKLEKEMRKTGKYRFVGKPHPKRELAKS